MIKSMEFSRSHRLLTREVLTHGPLSRTELARRLGLSPASLTRLAKPLLDEGLFVESGMQREQRTGRPVRPLDVVSGDRYFVGINVRADDLTAVVTTLRAEVRASCRNDLVGRAVKDVVSSIEHAVTAFELDPSSLYGLGVSLGGNVRNHTVVTHAPFLEWSTNVDLGALIESATRLPTVVDNDLLALTRAEHWFGVARDADHFAVITIGAGVGYGLVVHDRVVEPVDAGIGLIGHYPIDPMGPLCSDGHRGCAVMLTVGSICTRVSMALRREVSYDDVLQLVTQGEPSATTVAREVGVGLGRLIAAVANLGMTPRVVLTGEGVGLASLVMADVQRGISLNRNPLARPIRLDVQPSDFTEWARGSAVLAIQASVLGLDG